MRPDEPVTAIATRTPTDVLRDEHVLIVRALDLLDTAAAPGAGGGATDGAWWAGIVAWLRGFADRNHHAKEECLLFPAMERAGVPAAGGPIAVMQEEHAEGRALINALDASVGVERAANARRYVELLRAHIDKENGVLFPLADAVLGDDAQRTLTREFDAVAADLGRLASESIALAELRALAAALEASAEPAGQR